MKIVVLETLWEVQNRVILSQISNYPYIKDNIIIPKIFTMKKIT